VSKWAKIALELIELSAMNLPLGLSMLISSEKLLTFTKLDIEFTISLLDAIIQDSGIKERSIAIF